MENAKIVKKGKDLGATIFIIAMLIIPIISFLFFYVYINFNSILLAFKDPLEGNLGLQNFETVFSHFTNVDGKFLSYLRNTLIYFCQDTFINMPLSLIICYFIFNKSTIYFF